MKTKILASSLEGNSIDDEELPEGWTLPKLGELIFITSGKSIDNLEYSKKPDKPYPVAGAGGPIGWADKFNFSPPIITLGRVGSAGSLNVYTTNIWVTDNTLVLKPNEKILLSFLAYYLRTIDWSGLSTGSTQPLITQTIVKNIPLPLPPITEQQRIVARIDALFSHISTGLDQLNRVPLIMKKFRKAVLAAASSGRLTEGWRVENPEIESGRQLLERIAGKGPHAPIPDGDDPPLTLPDIPDTWEWSRCSTLCDPKRDITYGVIKLGPTVKGGIPTLRSSDVRWLYIDDSDVKTIDLNIASQYSRTFLKGGEIVVTVRGSLGGVAVVPQSMAGHNISREVAVLPFLSVLDVKYFSYAIASIWSQNWLSEVTKGVAYTGFNIRDLKRLPLALPPLAEQHEIVHRVGMLFERADVIEREVVAATKRTEALTQAVLGKAFRGELVPPDMADVVT